MKKQLISAIIILMALSRGNGETNLLTSQHIMFSSGLKYYYAVKQKSSIEGASSVQIYKSVMEYTNTRRDASQMYIPLNRAETLIKGGSKQTYISRFLKKADGIYFYIKGYERPIKFFIYSMAYWQDKANIKNSKGVFYISGRVIGVRAVKVPYSRFKLKALKVEIKTKVSFTGYSLVDKSYYYFVKNLGLVMQERKGIIYLLEKTSLGTGRGERATGRLIANLSGIDAELYLLGVKRHKSLKLYYSRLYKPFQTNSLRAGLEALSRAWGNISSFRVLSRIKYAPLRVFATKSGLIEQKYLKKTGSDFFTLYARRFGIPFTRKRYRASINLGGISGYGRPLIYKNMVFVSNIRGRLFCINLNTGKKMWSNILPSRSASPYISGGFIYISTTYPDNALYCLNIRGHIMWRTSLHTRRDRRHRKADYALCMPGNIYAYKRIIALQSAGGDIVGVLKSSGKIIWRYKVGFKNRQPKFYINGNGRAYLEKGCLFFYDLDKTITALEIISGKVVLKRKLGLKRKYSHAYFLPKGFVVFANHADLFFNLSKPFSLAVAHLYSGAVINESGEGFLKGSYAYRLKYYKGRLFVQFRELLGGVSRWNYLCILSLPDFKVIHKMKHLSIQRGNAARLVRDYSISFDFYRNYVFFAPEGYFYLLYLK